ncbi:hypothetical protein [Clostridium autoethanogenum]|uniref:Uncharacterized protein n=1 Tax=Clostridium autoethanogenum DSM 10061 TaxID=1341692 RepID=A0ABM5NS87_9CLOT|nr:hypothetical protein [Clostridium autoethanogenum]AGY75245.1 hypothetical protein CAETHG_1020 [Clostridium autoethanogenum DSM 10061]ALU35414.1 Hypothetical protein CLAU_0985 [Clostridium autoethanogenum DSM 10061]OVY49507.1 hypothetical protein WX72_03432 [Clostridium autoethanogenum]
MIEFIKDKEIKKEYKVYGSFYNVYKYSKKLLECRNALEIVKKDCALNFSNKLYMHVPDALVIMMNQGGSKPINYAPQQIQLESLCRNILKVNLVLADPDKAQFQIMRLMNYKGWKNVRVINLSDIRDGDSNSFFKKVKSFEDKYFSDIHSIFSKQRICEKQLAFSVGNDAPIILAWGLDTRLMLLTSRYMKFIPSEKIKGIAAHLYSHASPRKQEDKKKWLQNIISVL